MATKDVLTAEDDEKQLTGKQEREEFVITEEDPAKKQEKPAAKADDHDDDEEDERLNGNQDVNPDDPDGKEREAIRERRRLEKLERKERREKAIARDKIEMEFLRKRNDELERRLGTVETRQQQADVTLVDQRMREALNEVEMAEKVIAKAVAAGNGEDVAQALRYRDQAMAKANQLKGVKDQVAKAPPQQAGKADDLTLHYAQEFVKENKWYDPQGRDEDSAIVLAIDSAMVRDGYDPKTTEYWDELKKRAARRLPDRFGDSASSPDKTERTSRGGPNLGSGREHAPTSTRKEVYISPERKQALIDAGVWDDPTLRMKYVKRYAAYDRENRS